MDIKKLTAAALIFAVLLCGVLYAYDSTAKVKLNNDAVLLVKEDYKMDIVSINILFKVGLKQEEADTSGATNLVKALLFRDDDTSSIIMEELESLGAQFAIESGPDYFSIQCQTNKENFVPCLDLIYNGLINQRFDLKPLEEVKGAVLKTLRDPSGYFGTIYDFFLQNFYRTHPYRYLRLGTSTAIRNITPDVITEFYRRYFSPNNMVVSVCGNINKTTALKELTKRFSGMPRTKLPLRKIDWEPPSKQNTIYLYLKGATAWIMAGYSAPSFKSPDYPAMLALKSYLADGTSSRIWNSIRETEGLAYDLGGIFPQLEGPSHFVVYVITDGNNTWDCKGKMFKEIDHIKNVMLDYKTLDKVKQKTIANFILGRERVSSQSANTAIAELLDMDYTYDERMQDKIMELTPGDIKRVANEYLVNPTIIIAKPSMSIQDMF